jgi:hypothetical protein
MIRPKHPLCPISQVMNNIHPSHAVYAQQLKTLTVQVRRQLLAANFLLAGNNRSIAWVNSG